MNLDKMSEEEKLKISRKYFIIGFFVLPAVWLANAIWFFKEAFIKRQGHPMIRRYVAGSMLGVLVWVAVVVIWTTVYQNTTSQLGGSGRLYIAHCTSWKVMIILTLAVISPVCH